MEYLIYLCVKLKNKKMIEANISSYIGQDNEAEHYYCHYREAEYEQPRKYGSVGYGSEELFRIITDQKEVSHLQRKDRHSWIKIGSKTNRFATIEQIHEELLNMFPNVNVVTYEDNQPFKGMLCIIGGINLGYKGLGELWLSVPHTCWKDLLPNKSEIVIKCENCGEIICFEDIVMDEYFYEIENKTIVKFATRGYEMSDKCCKYPELVWNVIL